MLGIELGKYKLLLQPNCVSIICISAIVLKDSKSQDCLFLLELKLMDLRGKCAKVIILESF